MWTQILRFYFPLQKGYGIEREPYTTETARARANIVVTNARENGINKVLFVECKSSKAKKTPNNRTWGSAKDQMRNYMLSWDGRRLNSPLYGVVAIGREARFYTLPARSDVLEEFKTGNETNTFSVKDGAASIHEILSRMESLILQDV